MTTSPKRICVLAGCVLTAIAAALPATASAGAECDSLANCTPVEDTPWVAVPSNARFVFWRTRCPTGMLAAGRDYNPSPAGTLGPVTTIFVDPGVGLDNSMTFVASGVSYNSSFQPLVGCVTAPTSATATAAGPRARTAVHRHVIRRYRIRPSRRRVHRARCPRGHRVLQSGYGVGFYTKRPPSRRTLADIRVRHRHRKGTARTVVRTGRRVGDDERVELQVHAICQRR